MYCPVCKKKIGRVNGNRGKGLLAIHFKYKHWEYWDGNLDSSIKIYESGIRHDKEY